MEDKSLACKPGLIWVTGYSSSGKTTVARKVNSLLKAQNCTTVLLDGDELRNIFTQTGYEREDRIGIGHSYFQLCSHLVSQGVTVILSAITMFNELETWVKDNIENTLEVFLDVPEHVLKSRDAKTKNVYANRSVKEFISSYDTPKYSHLTINNDDIAPSEVAQEIVDTFFKMAKTNGKSTESKSKYWNSYYSKAVAPTEPSPFARELAEELGVSSPVGILEVGCGNGRDAVFFAGQGHAVTALDTSCEAISHCELHFGKQVCFVNSTIDDFIKQPPQHPIDIVYSRFSLHAMKPCEENHFLTSAWNLLDDGGRIYIECRSVNDLRMRKGEVVSPTERIDGHYRRFIVLDELVASLSDLGFTIEFAYEGTGLAVAAHEDPCMVRVCAIK